MAEDLEISVQLEIFESMLMLRNSANKVIECNLRGIHFSLRECEMLMYIYQHGQTSTSELAKVFKVTRTLVSKTISQLMQAKIVQEQTNLDDRRRVCISLTEMGISQIRVVKERISNNLQNIDLTEELLRVAQRTANVSQRLSELKKKLG
ncbi:MarR family transcriptional regulator [Lactobacillus plantarum]|uniref:MarR family winged helix-turn-helix transcriptional regulator n=1 Tax=Lactiplantibacillus plantarum TaxID=1590 RepID=UPI00143CC2FB|nr:MarR family transcriptional regulator [Lactiplantibacillus plantarum]MBE1727601.1 MarR family transcriptional regulator [Lactiplantibacillus plantarum]NKI39644.1 MarR family transcriptional regulator [Lactiplantibacillus plantarum]